MEGSDHYQKHVTARAPDRQSDHNGKSADIGLYDTYILQAVMSNYMSCTIAILF